MKNFYACCFVALVLGACAVPYVEPFDVDPGTAQWRDKYIRGI